MLRTKKIIKVIGLLGSGLITVTGLTIFILNLVEILGSSGLGERGFSVGLLVIFIPMFYILPGALALLLSILNSGKLNAVFVWSAVIHTLAGPWFIIISALIFIRISEISSNTDTTLNLIFAVINGLGGILLLLSGIARIGIIISELSGAPRNGGYPQYYR